MKQNPEARKNGKNTGKSKPPVEHQFKSGNPGRPKGAKNKFTEDFWRDLRDAWEANGPAVIQRVINEDPGRFLTVAANMLPKEVEVTNKEFVVVVPAQADSVDEWLSQNQIETTRPTVQ
jgi:hypothetical protein